MKGPLLPLIFIFLLVSFTQAVYYATCLESATRTCSHGTNITDRLLSLKKGGSNLPATNTYDQNFFLCEQYNYNCGYLQQQNDFLTIANGMQLNMTYSELLQIIPSDATLTNLIKPYLNSSGSGAKCLNNYFPLALTDAQSATAMAGILARLNSNFSATYATKKASTSLSWLNLNINIITATLQMAKLNMNGNFATTNYWNYLLTNNFTAMASQLKSNYQNTNKLEYLRSSYLIDSVTLPYNKYQSVNFLIDQSSSIGTTNFNYVKTFLTNYITQTNDDLSLMSINYFDATFDTSVSYGSSKSAILSAISSKTCRCTGNGNLGDAINNTITKINAAGYSNGLNKILVVFVGSTSSDNVYYASEYARSLGITLIAVAIGGGYSNSQLLQVAYTQSNLIYVSSYAAVTNFHNQLPNVLAHQYMDIPLNSKLNGCYVRSASNPNYYRLPRDYISNKTYYISVTFANDPAQQQLKVYQSHYDPFPDKYSDCNCTLSYRTSVNTYEYYITPANELESIAIKKDIKVSRFFYYTFITIGGNNLSYSITLKDCTTKNCSVEIAAAEKIGSLNTDNSLSEEDAGSMIDPSIFVAIGGGIFTLALGTYATINGLRKIKESPHQPDEDNLETNQDLQANNQDNLVRNNQHEGHHGNRHQHHHQHHHDRHVRGSHQRNRNQRQSNRSHRSAQRKNHKKKEQEKSSWDDDSECYIEDKKSVDKMKKNQEKVSNKSQNESNKSHKSNSHSNKQEKHEERKGDEEKKEKKKTPQKNRKGTPQKKRQNKK